MSAERWTPAPREGQRLTSGHGPALRPRLTRAGLGRLGRPDQGPGGHPRLGHHRGARRSCASRSWPRWPSTPTAARPRSRPCTWPRTSHGWCSPEAITQVAAVMQVTPAYLISVATFYDMFKTTPRAAQRHLRVHEHLVLAAGRRRAVRRPCSDAATDEVDVRSFECLGRLRHRTDGLGQRRVHRPADHRRRPADHRGPAGRPTRARAQAAALPPLRRPRRGRGRARFRSAVGQTPRADTAGLGPEGDPVDRPGPTAAIEIPREEADE